MKFLSAVNWPIIVPSLFLVSIGILVIYSSSTELAIQQFIYTLVGLFLFILISQLDSPSLKKFINPVYIVTLILLITVLILGYETRGSVRWIPLGFFNIQPSEFAKIALLLFLASFWTKNIPTWLNILKSFVWIAPIIFLVFIQPDLGSTLTLMSIWIGMLLVSRISVKKIMILILIAVFIIPSGFLFLKDYQKQRITSFLTPQLDPLGRGYNVIQSRLQFLPEFRTDFIFASIAEELGFVGSILILSIYFYLLTFCLRSASKINDNFSFLLTFGVFFMLIFQIFVNIGMNVGIVPITGITLPLISYGGSSLIVTFMVLGLIASVVKRTRRIDKEED